MFRFDPAVKRVADTNIYEAPSDSGVTHTSARSVDGEDETGAIVYDGVERLMRKRVVEVISVAVGV